MKEQQTVSLEEVLDVLSDVPAPSADRRAAHHLALMAQVDRARREHPEVVDDSAAQNGPQQRGMIGFLAKLGLGSTGAYATAKTMAAAATVVVVGMAGVTFAANGASPGDALYGVDRTVENIQFALAPNEGARAKMQLRFAGERLDEALTATDASESNAALESLDMLRASVQETLADGNLSDGLRSDVEAGLAALTAALDAAGLDEDSPIDEIEIYGVLDNIDDEMVIVDGVIYALAPDAEIKGEPKTGTQVRVHLTTLPDGTIVARKVEAVIAAGDEDPGEAAVGAGDDNTDDDDESDTESVDGEDDDSEAENVDGSDDVQDGSDDTSTSGNSTSGSDDDNSGSGSDDDDGNDNSASDRNDNSGSDDDDDSDKGNDNSGSDDDGSEDDDNSGSGSDDDDSDDNSGSGNDDDEDDEDNSGSGSSDDDEEEDNSGSGSNDDDEEEDNSGSGSSDDEDEEEEEKDD